jgi:hypothetical protein
MKKTLLLLLYRPRHERRGPVARLSALKPVFDHKPVDVGFAENEVALKLFCLQLLLFSSVNKIPPKFHIHLYLKVLPDGEMCLTWKTSRRLSCF